jgi:cytochrome P450
MIEHPGIQQKAREEVDRVVGPERLPTLDDMDNLTYVKAVIQEVSATLNIAADSRH